VRRNRIARDIWIATRTDLGHRDWPLLGIYFPHGQADDVLPDYPLGT